MGAGRTMFNVVFAVCHPDDEALWVGGLIHELSKLPFLRVSVICLSGADPSSPREAEFHAAREVLGYADGVVLGFPLRPAPTPLPPTPETVEQGLGHIGLSRSEIDVLITHSPYGEEHTHPHHRQAYRELLAWSNEHGVPFGYFSVLPIPFFAHVPLLHNLKRSGALHVLSFARCEPRGVPAEYGSAPDYYLQFLTDMGVKQRALDCYPSIDLQQHAAGYAAFTSACESVYLFGDRALAPFAMVMDELEVPGVPDLFPDDAAPSQSNIRSVVRRVVPARVRRAMRGA
jgi:LmbE family N-acetylglucosaminyl deacetylase